jgi:hypothetical protein
MDRNKLAALTARKEKLIIPSDKTPDKEILDVDIKGLSFKELAKFSHYAENNDTEGAINYALFITLRKSIPKEGDLGLNDEELKKLVDELDAGIGTEIIKKVMELSGLETPKKSKKDGETA